VVHGLVYPTAVRDEPEVDRAEAGEDLTANAGFLGYLTNCGLFRGFTGLDMPLR
jgi:hypothetical protein